MGMFTIAEFIGLLLGLYFIFRYKGNNLKWFILSALFIAPLPSSITFDDFPNFQRALYLMPFWEITAGYGIYNLINVSKKYKKLIIMPFIFILTFQFIFFMYQYFLISPVHEPFYRNYEEKELASFLNREDIKKYDKIGISDSRGTYIFYLFFNKLDVFDLNVKKDGKYFQGDFYFSNLAFSKKGCLGADEYLKEEYSLTIQQENCKKFSFNKPIHSFRRKDNSLILVAYETDKKLFEEFKIKNINLLNCSKRIFDRYSVNGREGIESVIDKDLKNKMYNELLICDKNYYED